MTEPRTVGLIPMFLLRPALPSLTRSCSMFPTTPIVALHSIGTILISPDGNLSVAYFPSLAISCAALPAARTSCPPLPLYNSILCTSVPTGIAERGKQLPTETSAFAPFSTVIPTFNPFGARI